MFKSKRANIGLTVLLILAGVYASALAEAPEVDLEKIVVTPGRSDEEVSQIPNNITVITGTQIEQSKVKSIPEILGRQSAVVIRDYYSNGKTVNADIRGFGETGLNNVLVLVDGRRVNNIDSTGTDWTQIPVSAVERIEILRGASSVMYGDNATGGVVNIITKGPGKKKLGLKLGASAGSYASYAEKGEVYFNTGGLSGLALFDQYRTDGYRINTDLLSNDFSGKLIYALNDRLKFKISGANHKDKYGLAGGLKDIELNTRDRRASVYPDDFARTGDYFLELGMSGDFQEYGKLELNLAKRKRSTFSNFVKSRWLSQRNTKTYTLNSKYLWEKDILGHNNKLTTGIDYFDARQNIDDGSYSGNPDKLVISKRNFGAYLSDELYILDKLSFNAGYRWEDAHYNFEQETAVHGSEASKFKENVFNTALNYSYLDNSNVYVSFSQGFRHPMVDEIYVNMYDYGGGPQGGLNTALTPQTSKNFEAGIRHYLKKDILLALSGFIIKTKDEIYYEPTTAANTNYDRTLRKGIEFNSELKMDDAFRFFAHYTFIEATFRGGTYDRKKIPAVPLHKWGVGGEAKFLKYLHFSLFGNYVGERYFISDQPNSLPRMAAYFTLDAKLSFAKDNYSLFFNINNLLGEKYYEYGAAGFDRTYKNYYPSPERNFTVGGEIKF